MMDYIGEAIQNPALTTAWWICGILNAVALVYYFRKEYRDSKDVGRPLKPAEIALRVVIAIICISIGPLGTIIIGAAAYRQYGGD